MAERILGLSAMMLMGLVGLGALGCATEDRRARTLDDVCRVMIPSSVPGEASLPACEVEGDATQTSSITGDSIGFLLGPRGGALRVRIAAFDYLIAEYYGPTSVNWWSIDALVASARIDGSELIRSVTWGSCSNCPDDPPDYSVDIGEDYAWVLVAEELEGLAPYGTTGGISVPTDAMLRLRGADIQIADIHYWSSDAGDEYD